MVRHLHRRVLEKGWLIPDESLTDGECLALGVVLQGPIGQSPRFISEPPDISNDLITACQKLDLNAAFTMSSEITSPFFSRLEEDQTEFRLHPYNLTVPVVNSLRELASGNMGVRKRDYICLIRHEKIALVWSHSPEELVGQALDVESKLLGVVSSLPK